jgi:hypothetical protein
MNSKLPEIKRRMERAVFTFFVTNFIIHFWFFKVLEMVLIKL